MINPFVLILVKILQLFRFQLTVWFILSLLIYFKIINIHQPLVYKLFYVLEKINGYFLAYIRKFIKPINGIDLSPIVLYLAIELLISILIYYG